MSNYSHSTYDDKNTNNSWFKALNLIAPNSKVLDIGCSSGHFGAELIARKSCIVDGIELNSHDAKEASKKLRSVHILNVETDKLDVLNDTYDIVYFGDVIEHLVDPVSALKKISSLLKKNGKIVFSIPNMAHITVRLQLLKGEFDYTETGLLDKTHLHFYNIVELHRVFAEAGYVIKVLDFTKKDYPNELIDNYLKTLGLVADEKFYKMMHQPEAAGFQFIGYAEIGNPAKVKRLQFGPIDMFESYFNNTIQPLRGHIKVLERENAKLVTENLELQIRFNNITKRPIRTVSRSLAHRLKRKRSR